MANLFPPLSYLDAQWPKARSSLQYCSGLIEQERNPTDVFPLSSLFRMMQHPEANSGFASPQHNVAASVAAADPDSDAEDDPGQLLNLWLGELNTLKKVS